jgi:Bacterial Ig-like domain (group 2)
MGERAGAWREEGSGMSRAKRRWLRACGIAALAMLAGCGTRKQASPAREAAAAPLRVAPSWKTLTKGATQQFTLTGGDRAGSARDSSGPVTWKSSNPAVATISPSGLATARSDGATRIEAAAGTRFAATTLLVAADAPVAGVFTYHNDLGRTGQNLGETILTPANVNAKEFGKLFSDPVDGYVYAQPLYVSNVAIPGRGRHNVVYVATEGDTVYAFDADQAGPPLWKKSLLGAGETSVPSPDTSCDQIVPQIGITSTPVIDPSTGTLYAVAMSKLGAAARTRYFQRLHALALTTGEEKFGAPVEISGEARGAGAGSSQGSIRFDAFLHLNRPGLALVGGNLYIGFGSHCDIGPYHGWIFAYAAASLARRAIYLTTPDGNEGAIWQAGGAPAADPAGNLYLMTGNGTFDGRTDFSDSFLKLGLEGSQIVRRDYFTPANEKTLEDEDLDVGSGGPMLLPDQPGPHPHLLAGAGKGGVLYLLDRDHLGGFHRRGNRVVAAVANGQRQNYSTPAYWNGRIYLAASKDVLKAFSLANGRLSPSPTAHAATAFGYPGATVSVSASGAKNGIVWALQIDWDSETNPDVLHAYDASDVARELYNSSQAPKGRDRADSGVKFAVPTVFNGKVYVGTQDHLDVYGLLR